MRGEGKWWPVPVRLKLTQSQMKTGVKVWMGVEYRQVWVKMFKK